MRVVSFLSLFLTFFVDASPRVVQLSPPRISSETVQQYIRCTRPVREGEFNISTENKEEKTLVHCYGFGGSGWTCLFGSVDRAIQLFEQSHPSKKTPIRVLGSGCMGLTCAIELSLRGYTVSGITSKDLYDSPSWKAGGLFAVSVTRSTPEEEHIVNEIAIHSFLTYRQIEEGNHPYLPKTDARLLPIYFPKGGGTSLFSLEKASLIAPREDVTLDFGNGLIYTDFSKYMTYFIDTAAAMLHLLKEVKNRSIPIEVREVHAFSEISEEIIFNCTGLGSFELNQDAELVPIYGHVVTLNPSSGNGHLDYMLAAGVEQNGQVEWVNLFPKTLSVTAEHPEGLPCAGVLGSTFLSGEEKWTDEEEFAKLIERASQFFNGDR